MTRHSLLRGPGLPSDDAGRARGARALALAAALVAGSLAVPVLAAAPASAATAQPLSQEFGYTGGNQFFEVPDGVQRVYVAATGAGGGDGNANGFCAFGHGGAGGTVTGYLDVTPHQLLVFFVGEGGHLTGAGGTGGLLHGGGTGGADGDVGSGNGGGGGGATTVYYGETRAVVAGGGGGGGGRGIGALQCGGDGGAASTPPQKGFNGTGAVGTYGLGGGTGGDGSDLNGGHGFGLSGSGGGGGGGDGATFGRGGTADQNTTGAGGGGGGGGGSSTADPILQQADFRTSGGSGSAGKVTVIWGNVTTTSVPPATAVGGSLPLHAIVSDSDGHGVVDFTYPTYDQYGIASPTPIPGCTGLPLTDVGDGVTFEATCNAKTETVGADTVTATYQGDYAYGPSSGSRTFTVQQLPSTITVSASPTTVAPFAGTQLTLTVQADGYGSVSVYDNGEVACYPLPLSPAGEGTATTSCFRQIVSGTHVITASYNGDRGYLPSTSSPVTVTTEGEPSITGAPPAGTVGTVYDFPYILAGNPAPTTSVTAGATPPGLTLSSAGRLSGTPTGTGTFAFTVTAANSVDTVHTDSTVTIGATVPGAPGIGSASAGNGSATVAFTPPASDGGAPITSYTATATPVGSGSAVTATGPAGPLTVTGLTNGTAYTLTVTATNASGTGPASAGAGPVTPRAPIPALQVTTSGPLPAGTVGKPYSAPLTASGGTTPYSWSLGTGSHLPAGLRLLPNGTVTGTPTAAGTATFGVTVADATRPAGTAVRQLSLTVLPAPKPDLTVALAPIGRFVHGRGGAYVVTVTNKGNAATTTASTVTLTLPGGLVAERSGGPGWSCTQQGRRCTFSGQLSPGRSASFVTLVKITAAAGSRLATTAVVTPADATPGDNRASVAIVIQRS